MDPTDLTVYASPCPKTRLGKIYDGGYVVVEIPTRYSILLAGGIYNDISFEEAVVLKYGVRCIAFDGSICALPSKNDAIDFVKKYIGNENTDTQTDLHDLISNHDGIFIKMDIEGGEIPWLHSLSDDQLNKFNQIVIEFHCPFTEKDDVFKKLNRNHVLVHFHGNNCCHSRTYKGVSIPNIFECTYIHKKFFTGTPPQLSTDAIPSSIDMRNLLKNDEICINHPPFVH